MRTDDRTEEQVLIMRAQRGEQDAFRVLVERYQGLVYTLALRMVARPEDAEDAAQEAFLAAWKALPKFRMDARFSTWLYRVTSNVCLDELRRRRRGETESMQVLEENGFEPVDPAETPEMALDRAELRRDLAEAISQLGSEQRAALILRDVQGLPYEEIAQILDLNLNTVKSRISRARSALREILLGKTELSAKKRV